MIPDTHPLILFVCTGNQIRSPIAAAIFQRLLAEAGLQDRYRVDSAGTWTVNGRSDPWAIETAFQMGFDIKEHRSRMIDKKLFSAAQLVIVMEQGQKEALQVENPEGRSKVYLLSQLAGEGAYNITDSSGLELEAYLETGNELLRLVKKSFDTICKLLQKS